MAFAKRAGGVVGKVAGVFEFRRPGRPFRRDQDPRFTIGSRRSWGMIHSLFCRLRLSGTVRRHVGAFFQPRQVGRQRLQVLLRRPSVEHDHALVRTNVAVFRQGLQAIETHRRLGQTLTPSACACGAWRFRCSTRSASGGKAIAGARPDRVAAVGRHARRAQAEGVSVCPETAVVFRLPANPDETRRHSSGRARGRVQHWGGAEVLEALPADLPRLEKGTDVAAALSR